MSRWFRVFVADDEQPRPEKVLEFLRSRGVTGPAQFRGDEQGWTALEFRPAEQGEPLVLECFLASEPGIRGELNTWAAWLETCEDAPEHGPLMERIIQTRQLYTLCRPGTADSLDELCANLCRFLASVTRGVYQIDGVGLHDAEARLLIPEG